MSDDGADDDDEAASSLWAWIAGIAGILILLLIGFLLFRFLTGGSPSGSPAPSGEPVTVPNLVGLDVEAAQLQAETLGLVVTTTGTEESSLAEGQILSQDPPAGGTVPSGTEIRVVTARGQIAVVVPDLRALTESEAINTITAAGLDRRHALRGVRPGDPGRRDR